MAELRYELTGLLEEEYKRRACIEQRALQRITELEAQVLINIIYLIFLEIIIEFLIFFFIFLLQSRLKKNEGKVLLMFVVFRMLKNVIVLVCVIEIVFMGRN